MTQPLNLALTLSLNDRLVGPLQRSLDQAKSELNKVSRELEQIGRTGQSAAQGLEAVGKKAAGLRETTNEVRKLGQETREAERSASRLASTWGQIRNVTRGVAGMAAGGAAFSAVVAAPLQRAADYDMDLRRLANTAYPRQGKGLPGQIASLDGAVTGAVRYGGGSRDDALNSLKSLIGAGVPVDQAMQLLPLMTRSASAFGGTAVGMSTIAKVALQNGFTAAQLPEILDRAGTAGQLGGFELPDMERHLPKLLAEAPNSGLVGMDGLQKVLALTQTAMTVSGTADQAGYAVLNLLGKLNSTDTAVDLKKLGRDDLAGMLLNARSRGLDSVDAFAEVINAESGKDPRMAALRKQAAGLPAGASRGENLAAQERILQGSVLGKVFQDRETRLAMIGYLNQPELMRKVMESGGTSAGTREENFASIAQGAGFRFAQQHFEALQAQTAALNATNGPLGRLADASAALYREFPLLGEAVQGAKVALTGLAGFLAAMGLARLLTPAAPAVAVGAGAAAQAAAGSFAAGTLSLGRLGGGIGFLGAGMSLGATNVVLNNLDMASGFMDDTGFAAAILSGGQAGQSDAAETQARAAEKFAAAVEKFANSGGVTGSWSESAEPSWVRAARRN